MGKQEEKYRTYHMALAGKKVPILILDYKWHQLFKKENKTSQIKKLEQDLNELLKKQGRLNHEEKELKRIKHRMMEQIIANMEITEDARIIKQREENKRLIEETNEKLRAIEEEIEKLPQQIRETNEKLLIESMAICYKQLHANQKKIKETEIWIEEVRAQLREQAGNKQEMESRNAQIYSYMHDILGPEIVDVFDLYEQQD